MPVVPHASLAKEQSHDEVYLIVGDGTQSKLHIRNPAEFDALAFDWGHVQIVPDGTLAAMPSCEMGPVTATKPSDVFFGNDIHVDPADGGFNIKEITAVVAHDVLIAGWMNDDFSWNVGNGEGFEDVSYSHLILDLDFMLRLYGHDGLSSRLNGLKIPGYPRDHGVADMTLAESPDKGITANSFSLSNTFDAQHLTTWLTIKTELNVWHKDSHLGEPRGFLGPLHRYTGRGPAPAGWINLPVENTGAGGYGHLPSPFFLNYQDQWLPSDPRYAHNEPNGSPLAKGDYLVLWGTLWQDAPHGTDYWGAVYPGIGGYLELHPVDWVGWFPPPLRRTIGYVASAVATTPDAPRTVTDTAGNPFAALQVPVADLPNAVVSDFTAHPDPRFTEHPEAVADTTNSNGAGIVVDLTLGAATRTAKTTYVMTWHNDPITLSVSGEPLALDQPVTFTVTATDILSGQPVPGLPVATNSGDQLGNTGTEVTRTYRSILKHGNNPDPLGKPHPYTYRVAPDVTLTVHVPGRLPASHTLEFMLPPNVPDEP